MPRASASLFRGYSVLTIGNLAASAAGFLAVLLIVERFGPEGLGKVTLAASIVGYVLILGSCGTQLHAVRRVAAAPENVAPIAGTVFGLRLVAGAAGYVALLGAASLVPRLAEIRPLLALFGLGVFIQAFNVSWVPQALNKAAVLAVSTLGVQLLYVFGVWRVAASGRDLTALALTKVGAEAVVALLLLAWVWRRFGPIRLPPSPRVVWQMAVEAAPIAGTKLVRGVALGSDLLVVGLMLSAEDLGHYAGAVRLFMFLMSLASAYFIVLLPRLARRRAEAGRALAVEIASSLRRVLLPAMAVVALMAWLARPLLTHLFTPSFGAATVALRLLMLALLANLIGRHFRQVLLVSDRQVLDLRATALAAGVHVAFKVVLVPLFGLTGAALGTLVGELTLMAILWWAARPELSTRRMPGSGLEDPERSGGNTLPPEESSGEAGERSEPL